VRTAANGMAVLTDPELKKLDLIIIDPTIEGVDGYTTTREIKTNRETHQSLILLLIPEESMTEQTDPPLRGANGYLRKPFAPQQLLEKTHLMLEERALGRKIREHLDQAADELMSQLAEQHMQKAVESKTQLIVERAIQNVITQIDQRTTQEVNVRVTQLTSEKEQELVRTTVQEVAKSMVEKLAERKVSEAIDIILADATDKAVKRATEKHLPAQLRERIKESLEHNLPREVSNKVHGAIERAIPDIFKEMSTKFDSVASKVVQNAAREKLPEIIENQLSLSLHSTLPKLVNDTLSKELRTQVGDYIAPEVERAQKKLTRLSIIFFIITLAVIGAFIGAQAFALLPASGG
jgi:DNA-binding response OmpR family regulator